MVGAGAGRETGRAECGAGKRRRTKWRSQRAPKMRRGERVAGACALVRVYTKPFGGELTCLRLSDDIIFVRAPELPNKRQSWGVRSCGGGDDREKARGGGRLYLRQSKAIITDAAFRSSRGRRPYPTEPNRYR